MPLTLSLFQGCQRESVFLWCTTFVLLCALCSTWTWGAVQVTGTERLWSLLCWRHSKTIWTQIWVTCSGGHCLSCEVGLHDLQGSLPALPILWFHDSLLANTALLPLGPGSQPTYTRWAKVRSCSSGPSAITATRTIFHKTCRFFPCGWKISIWPML